MTAEKGHVRPEHVLNGSKGSRRFRCRRIRDPGETVDRVQLRDVFLTGALAQFAIRTLAYGYGFIYLLDISTN